MINQPTLESELSYGKNLAAALKTKQKVDSSQATLYQDARSSGQPLTLSFAMGAGETKKVRLTYSHPDAPTPFVSYQSLLTTPGIASNIVRDPTVISNKFITVWTVFLTNTVAAQTVTISFGVRSSAPGTLSGILI